jgi:hypothetical protein
MCVDSSAPITAAAASLADSPGSFFTSVAARGNLGTFTSFSGVEYRKPGEPPGVISARNAFAGTGFNNQKNTLDVSRIIGETAE